MQAEFGVVHPGYMWKRPTRYIWGAASPTSGPQYVVFALSHHTTPHTTNVGHKPHRMSCCILVCIRAGAPMLACYIIDAALHQCCRATSLMLHWISAVAATSVILLRRKRHCTPSVLNTSTTTNRTARQLLGVCAPTALSARTSHSECTRQLLGVRAPIARSARAIRSECSRQPL
jgi:hypothetical protein